MMTNWLGCDNKINREWNNCFFTESNETLAAKCSCITLNQSKDSFHCTCHPHRTLAIHRFPNKHKQTTSKRTTLPLHAAANTQCIHSQQCEILFDMCLEHWRNDLPLDRNTLCTIFGLTRNTDRWPLPKVNVDQEMKRERPAKLTDVLGKQLQILHKLGTQTLAISQGAIQNLRC